MNKHLMPALILCVLCACSGASFTDFSNMSQECESAHRLYAAYLDKLETTGRFSSDKMACFRRGHAMMLAAYRNRKSSRYPTDEETVNQSCRGLETVTLEQMQRAEDIPSLSQEEFDADWGSMKCSL
ncbi:MAG: hypothetical protein LBF50_00185 [Azoarcus sp.]|jgi:hypothetical protein|nr:hypothetical protein [Azoarcus sp.]